MKASSWLGPLSFEFCVQWYGIGRLKQTSKPRGGGRPPWGEHRRPSFGAWAFCGRRSLTGLFLAVRGWVHRRFNRSGGVYPDVGRRIYDLFRLAW